MSWEALRLTSRSPAEVYAVLGPHGVDELIQKVRGDCWRQQPADDRSLESAKKSVMDVFHRNMAAWEGMKKPSPQGFFLNLLPNEADHHMRQAMVLCWMMLPHGKRSLEAVRQIVTGIVERNMNAWEEDNLAFTKGQGVSGRAGRTSRAKGKRAAAKALGKTSKAGRRR